MSSSQDPFNLIRQELQESVNELQNKFSQWSSISPSSHTRLKSGESINKMCKSISWQLDEIQHAIEKAMQNPEKFKITSMELENRQNWLKTTRRQVSSMQESVKAAAERAQRNNASHDAFANQENERFITNTKMEQEMIIRHQDDDLDDMERAVSRIGMVGRTIHDELTAQHRMLNDLDEDIDTTSSKMRAATKKIGEVIKKASGNWQLYAIVILTVILIILLALAITL